MSSIRTPLTVSPHEYFGDATGRPLDYGTIYFGEPDKDPEFYPIDVYSDEALTQPIPQPIRTKGGFINVNGDIIEIYGRPAIYSVKVLDQYGRKIFYKGKAMRNNVNDDIIAEIDAAIQQSKDDGVEYAKKTVREAINKEAIEGGEQVDTFVVATPKLKGSIARTQAQKNAEHVSVKDFGALGDNSGATVDHWYTAGSLHYRGYASLAAVQADYPHVTSADDTIDWAACQAAWNSSSSKILHPDGVYVLSRPLKTKHSGSSLRNDTSQTIYGEGFKTIFSRKIVAQEAVRVPLTATNEQKATADIDNFNNSTLAVHGSSNTFHSFQINEGSVGLYLGQDHAVTELSAVYHNRFDNILIKDTSIALLMAASYGNHYNKFTNIHFIQNQFDCIMKNGARWTDSNNNNRNTFTGIRSWRSRIGLWIESGDSNVAYSWHGEGGGTDAKFNQYPVPINMPDNITSGVHVIGGQLNRLFACQMEGNEIELYNYGYHNEFYANGYHEATAGGTQVINKTMPAKFISRNTHYSSEFAYLTNSNQLAFPNIPAGIPIFTGNQIHHNTPTVQHKNPAHTTTSRTDNQFELGALTANTATSVNIWKSVSSPFSAAFKITVTASNNASNLSYITTATVTALRSSSGTLIRYYLSNVSSARASGEGAGDSSEIVMLSLTASGKDLMLSVTAPTNRDLTASAVHVESLITKA